MISLRGIGVGHRWAGIFVTGSLFACAGNGHVHAAVINTSTEIATGFEDGRLSPWAVNLTKSPNSVSVVQPDFGAAEGTHSARFFWSEAAYDGTRSTRGAEINDALSYPKEGWQAYSLYVPSVGFPVDKTLTISQIFCGGGNYNSGSWGAMIEIQNDSLCVTYRGNAVATQPVHEVFGSIPRDAWFRIIVHFVASHVGRGEIQIWADGASQDHPSYSATNIDFGFGDWNTTTDSLLTDGSQIGLKMGMYNWDTGNYQAGETRTLYYDSPVELVGGGSAGYQIVAGVSVPEPSAELLLPWASLGLLRRRSPSK